MADDVIFLQVAQIASATDIGVGDRSLYYAPFDVEANIFDTKQPSTTNRYWMQLLGQKPVPTARKMQN